MNKKEIDLSFLDDDSKEVVNEVAVKKRDPRGHKTEDLVFTNKGDNAMYVKIIRKTASMPPVDLNNAQQIEERINWFFDLCESCDTKPTVAGLASALGCTRQTLWNYNNNNTKKNTPQAQLIKNVYVMLEQLWEMWMVNGKINPVSGIFIGKNNFGYRDQQEMVITPNNPLGEAGNAENIKDKYIENNADIIDDTEPEN